MLNAALQVGQPNQGCRSLGESMRQTTKNGKESLSVLYSTPGPTRWRSESLPVAFKSVPQRNPDCRCVECRL